MKQITLNIPDHDCSCEVTQNPHLQSKVSMAFKHNPQKDYYQTVAEFFETSCDHEHIQEDFLDHDDYLEAIRINELWCIQWYPKTPIGFCRIYASSIEKLNAALALTAIQEFSFKEGD